MSKWSSLDKVDWAYFGPGFNGSGFLYGDQQYDNSPSHFTICGFAGKFTAAHLHRLLWATQTQFAGIQLRCWFREVQAEQLEQLAKEGLVTWRVSNSPNEHEVEILSVLPPTSDKPYIQSLAGRMLTKFRRLRHAKT